MSGAGRERGDAMKNRVSRWALCIGLLPALAACDNVTDYDDLGDGGPEIETAQLQPGGYDGVDLLIAIDDSVSMTEERAILATSLFPLVDALANPIKTDFPETNWPYDAADELRIAVVTSNMGLSSAGVSNDDEWPGTIPEECAGLGDDGAFQEIAVADVTIQNDVIPCDATAAQCPTGWTCLGAEDTDDTPGLGACHTDGETTVSCPDLETPWSETFTDAPNPDFAVQASCLAQRGIDGCDFEQPLQSLATALVQGDQPEFLHDSHLLAVVAVSDEDDCSMEDGEGLFGEDEVQSPEESKLGLACGLHDEYLFDPSYFYTQFVNAKSPMGVMFVAIVGVPNQGAGGEACQGPGDVLNDCLVQDEMQLTLEQPDAPADNTWFFRPACTRSVGETEAARAYPGRRYVELANESFGTMSYVYSICNADWSPAMSEIAKILEQPFMGTCLEKPVAWDSASQVAACDVTVEYVNQGEVCPEIFGDVEPVIETETNDEGEEVVLMHCPIPEIPFALECGDQEADQDAFGWYYCENLTGEYACPYVVAFTDAVYSELSGQQIDVSCQVADVQAL
jgi:hypothetical protein